jgi:N,N'-diacetyllegionaminate synthase
MRINGIDLDQRVYIVAEIGNNHEGSVALAEEMIWRAADAGVDAVKFQTFIPDHYVSSSDAARLERLRRFQLSHEQFLELAGVAEKAGVCFFSTPFDLESAKFLNTVQTVFKISSGDNTFFPLIETVASYEKPTIISTGLADVALLDKIRAFWCQKSSADKLMFLHCVASYPAPEDQANLRAISTLKERYKDVTIGYSDHTIGIDAAIYAVAAGARLIEKHFTIDKNYSSFRDHQLSADPDDMRRLVDSVRRASAMMGDGRKVPQACEEELLIAARRSVAVARDLDEGTVLTYEHLTWVRPGTGVSPGNESLVLNRKIGRSLKQGEIIKIQDLR